MGLRRFMRIGLVAMTAAAVPCAFAQPPSRSPVISPEVHDDHSVTFRFRDPSAQSVKLNLEGAKSMLMEKDDQGVWSVTTPPLEPDFYGYSFNADGVNLIDPSNWMMKPNLISTSSQVHVPGPASLPWEVNDNAHGAVHHHFYRSAVVGDQRDYFVYTPPGYNAKAKQSYPVLYLLHGFSDDASGWTAVGRANVIFDNLIAQEKCKPLVVVMPLGYGAPEIVKEGFGAPDHDGLRQRNFDKFSETLLSEVIPQVEEAYRVKKDRADRAIAGLSMGGAESLRTGLRNLDRFAWIASFSAGELAGTFDSVFPTLDAKANAQIRLLWIACGTDDSLIKGNRNFREWLKSKGVNHEDIETPGAHTWMVWRRNLSNLAPLLFR